MPQHVEEARARAEAQLRISEERFRHIFENAAVGIAEVGLDGRFVTVNSKLCEITGYQRAELLERTFQEITHPDDLAADVLLAAQLAEGTLHYYTMEKRYIRKDGSVVFVNLSGSAVRGDDGAPVHFVAIVEDISVRRGAEEALRRSEQQFRSVFRHAGTGIIVSDMAGRILRCNPAYEALLGYTQQELREMDVLSLVHPDDRLVNARQVEALRSGALPHFEIENRYVRKDGAPVWVHKFVALLHDADQAPAQMMALITDITDQRAAQDTQRETMRQKDEFIAVLAHELRNPLAPIRASVSVLRSISPQDPVLARCRDVIDRQVLHMARLIDDLLDVSRLSRGELRLQLSPTLLSSVIEDAAELAEPLLLQQRQTLVVDGTPIQIVIEADAARLTQVVGNLLNNAAKYSPPDTEIRLSIEREVDAVVIRVRDQGVGIPEAQIERVFDLFAQTDSARALSKGGLGIGLALARRIVEMHGGTIAASSPGPGRGSEFIVRLPAPPEPLSPAPLDAADANGCEAELEGQRVLVADDNVDAAEMLAMLFEHAGCEVRRVHDGESAVLEAGRFRPHLIVLDIGMPGMDGYETCQRVRREPWGASTRVVALTGRGRDSDRQQSLAAGFDQHFVKPVDTDLLLQLLQHR